MNVNSEIFEVVTDNLETVLDAVPILPPAEVHRYEYYANELSKKVLFDFFDCPESSEKNPEKILGAIFDASLLICKLFDATNDMEQQECSISSLIEDYDVWDAGRLEKMIVDDKEYMDYVTTKELAIEETLFLTYQRFGLKIDDNSALKDMLSVLIAFSIFAFRITFDMTSKSIFKIEKRP